MTRWYICVKAKTKTRTRPGVHEEVVHLNEGEDHVEDGVDAGEDVPGAAAHRNLKDQRSPFV